jgi:hypothetical protein
MVPALVLLAVLAACTATGNSGDSGSAARRDIGTGGYSNDLGGGPAARQASSYQDELRAENSK